MARPTKGKVVERRYEYRATHERMERIEARFRASGLKSRSEFFARCLETQDFERWVQLSQRLALVGQAINVLLAHIQISGCPHCAAKVGAVCDDGVKMMRAVMRAIPTPERPK